MKKIYILLMHSNTIPSKFVSFFTNYKFSHVSLSLDKECNITYSFGRKKVNSILNGGFVEEAKSGKFFKKFKNTRCRIYEMNITDKQFQKLTNIINKIKINSNFYKYDFIGIIPRYFGIPITIKNRFVCSHFVAFLLNEANIYNFKKNVCLIKPKDFEKISISKVIYEGLYQEYNVLN